MRVEIITFLSLLLRAHSLESNTNNNPQLLHEGTTICSDNHMGTECEIELDVPSDCVKDGVSDCPIVLMFHDKDEDDAVAKFLNVHEHNVIGVYPEGKCGGWNTEYDELACDKDADDIGFVKDIIADIRTRGAHGNVYAVGNKNGAALALKLAVNADDVALPIRGIITVWGELLQNSGLEDSNFHQPQLSSPFMSVLSIDGNKDDLTAYDLGDMVDEIELMPSEESISAWASHDLCRLPPNRTEVRVTTEISAQHHVFENCALAIVEYFKVEGEVLPDIKFDGKGLTELYSQFIGDVERKLLTEPVDEMLGDDEDEDECLEYFDLTMTHCFDHDEWSVIIDGDTMTCADVAEDTELCGQPEVSRCANATQACALTCLPICETMEKPDEEMEMVAIDEMTEMSGAPTMTATGTPTPAPTKAPVVTPAPTAAVVTAEPTPGPTPVPSYIEADHTLPPTMFVCEDDDMWVGMTAPYPTCLDASKDSSLCGKSIVGFDGDSLDDACKKSCGKCSK